MAHETTLYSVLRVAENASPEEIKQAYRKLVKLWHPDLHPDDMSAEKRMQEITEAYTVLSDQAKKWKYDESLQRKRSQLRAKQEEQARREAAAAAAAAAAANAAANAAIRNQQKKDPDCPPAAGSSYGSTYYEDFTKPSYPSSGNYGGATAPFVAAKSKEPAVAQRRSGAVEKLTSGEKRLENASVMLCVLFPVLIPIVHKHIKESLKLYPESIHYKDSLLSLKIITAFAVPLWSFLIFLTIKAVLFHAV